MNRAGVDRSAWWDRGAAAGAVLALIMGLTALSGWILGIRELSTFGADRIPMAPSTALLFMLFGAVELYRWRGAGSAGNCKLARAVSILGIVLAFILLGLSLFGIQLDIEHFWFSDVGTVAGAPIGHMSPLTAFCFILAGISQLAVLSPGHDSSSGIKAAFSLSLALMLISFMLIGAYLLGTPLLYDSGTIPPALTTSLAFLFLAVSLFAPAAGRISFIEGQDHQDYRGKGRPLFLLLLLSAMVVLFLAWIYFDGYRERFREEASHELSAIADLKVRELAWWREERISDARVFYGNGDFSLLVNRFLEESGDSDPENRLLVWLRQVREAYSYDRVAIFNRRGEPLLAFPEDREEPDPHLSERVREATRSGDIIFLDFHLHEEDGKPYLGVLVPISAPDPGAGFTSVLLMRIDPAQFLYPMISGWPVPSESAETLLVRRDGDELLFLNNLRFDDSAAMRLKMPLAGSSLPAARAVLGEEGIVEGPDYRGVHVLAAIRQVPGLPWFLVARMDIKEVYAPLQERMWLIILLAAGLIVLAGAVVGAVWQSGIKSYYRELHQAESRYSTTLNSIGDGVIVADTSGKLALMNPVAEEMTGWRAEEAAGRPLEEVFPIVNEYTGEVVQNPVEKVLEGGLVVGLANHTVLRSRDGRELPISDSGAPIRDREGRITGVVLVFSDKSGEREAEQRLIEREAKYRGLFNSIRDAILVTDTDRRIIDCNPAFTDLFGYSVEEISGQETKVVYENEEEFREMGGLILANIDNPSFLHRINYRDRSGRVFPGETNVFFLKDADGEVIGFIGMIRDITERKKQEREKESLHEQLAQSQKMESVGRLAGGVAHDFNNMLSVIIGNLELAMDRIDDADPLRSDLERIHRSAMRSADLTRQLLAFARKQTISPRVLDLNETLQGMLNMLRRLIGEDIELAWIPGENLWPLKIDPAQIDQVLANLLVNARDAVSGVGKVTIETANVEVDPDYCAHNAGFVPGRYVTLSVSDNGCGMTGEVLENIFEPFFTTKRIGEGTGLGLSTVYGIVKQNGGFVNVYSEPGSGTKFKIYLARYEGTEEAIPSPASSAQSKGGTETILVVEDEESLLLMSRLMLERLGYSVLTAGSPGEALQLMGDRSNEIDLLITDVIMPEMNGRELYQRLKQECPGLRTLFMSGYTANVIAHHGVLDEDVHFMEKPFSLKILGNKVREALDGA